MNFKDILRHSATLFFILLFSSNFTNAQDLNENLTFFKPLLNKTWKGHFQNPVVEEITHICKWDIIKSGYAVRLNKSVPEVKGFEMEITYYYDAMDKEVKFLTITNNGHLSRGTVTNEGNRIITIGWQMGPNGVKKVKQTFEVGEDGNLHDYFGSAEADENFRGHYIKYTVEN